jgi:hypothetical protein
MNLCLEEDTKHFEYILTILKYTVLRIYRCNNIRQPEAIQVSHFNFLGVSTSSSVTI